MHTPLEISQQVLTSSCWTTVSEIVSAIPMVLCALDEQGVFTFCEGKGLEVLGLKPPEIVGRSVFELYKHQPDNLEKIRRVLAGIEVAWNRVVGDSIYENWAAPLWQQGRVKGMSWAVILRNREDKIAGTTAPKVKQPEEVRVAQLKKQLAKQTAIAQLSQKALNNIPLATLLADAASLISRTLEVEACQVLEWHSHDQTWAVCASARPLNSDAPAQTLGDRQLTLTCELTYLADQTRENGRSLVVENWQQFCGTMGSQDSSQERGVCAATAIDTQPQPFGVLLVEICQEYSFDREDLRFLEDIGDILAQAISQQRSQEQLRLLASAVQHAEESILITTTQMNEPGPEIIFVNPAFTKMTGYSAQEAIGKTPRILQGPQTDRSVLDRLRKDLSQRQVFYGEAINYRKDGTPFYNEWHIEPILDSLGNNTHYLAIQRDVTKRKQAEERLYYDAFHDGLTGLPNRALFMKKLREACLQSSQESGYEFALLFVDLDRFKMINDSLGHLAGDQLLIEVAQRLQDCLPSSEIVARLGGDEFVILLTSTHARNPQYVARQIQETLAVPFNVKGHEVFITASIGIALSGSHNNLTEQGTNSDSALFAEDRLRTYGFENCPYDSGISQDLLRNADIAMYRAKVQGGRQMVVFNQKMHDACVSRLKLESDLRRAIDRQELLLHYQPIVSLTTGRITGFEALVRWQHPTRGRISPVEFIPVAEETGLIIPLGWWVLEEACTQLVSWQQQFQIDKRLTMSVNLSVKQFAQPDLMEKLEQVLQRTGCDRHGLKLEITESTLMENEELVLTTLERLKALGIELAIDDFGTGYSSLSRLHYLPVKTLKIDRSFISRMHLDRENAELVRTIVSLADNLGMDVTAEGLELTEQLGQLRDLRCAQGQGYFFSKPLSSQAATDLIFQMPQW